MFLKIISNIHRVERNSRVEIAEEDHHPDVQEVIKDPALIKNVLHRLNPCSTREQIRNRRREHQD